MDKETGKEIVIEGTKEAIELSALSPQQVVAQVKLVQEVMNAVMKEGEHYGTIPGTTKPTLLKPGAEKLCFTFRLEPDFSILNGVKEDKFIAYTVKCQLTHILSGKLIAHGIGSCNSRERKYFYRIVETELPVPQEYWTLRKTNPPEAQKLLGGEDRSVKKVEGKWVICKREVNENPWDMDNTLVKMACKRALIAATLNATAASDIFTQDIEDFPEELVKKTDTDTPMAKEMNGNIKKETNGTIEARSKSNNLQFLRAMSNLKKLVGEETYYHYLNSAGYEHANDITDRTVQETLYGQLVQEKKNIQKILWREFQIVLSSAIEKGYNWDHRITANSFKDLTVEQMKNEIEELKRYLEDSANTR